MFPILQRCHTCALSELLYKVSQIVEAAFQTDFRHLQIRLLQKALRLPDVLYRRMPDRLSKKPAKILLVQVYLSGKVRNIDFTVIILLDKQERGLNTLHTLVEISFYGHKKSVLGQCRKNMEQRRLDIQLTS